MRHSEIKFINHKAENLFNLVSDVKKYPEFLPWCLGSRVKKINENNLRADLIVGFKIYREVFKSNVILNKKYVHIEDTFKDVGGAGPLAGVLSAIIWAKKVCPKSKYDI